jgi:Notch-like protein
MLTNINPLHYLDSRYNSTSENIRWHCTSIAEIRKVITCLKTKSYGYDEISTKILKVSMSYIISPLTYICNESLAQGIFPDRLKFAVVKPIFKNDDKCEPSNCRPISLLSSFCKVFERLIYNRFFEHININNILDNDQYGFRPNSSTEKASFKLTDKMLKSMNNKHLVGGIFCDLQKTFDCVSHDILKIGVLWNYCKIRCLN